MRRRCWWLAYLASHRAYLRPIALMLCFSNRGSVVSAIPAPVTLGRPRLHVLHHSGLSEIRLKRLLLRRRVWHHQDPDHEIPLG